MRLNVCVCECVRARACVYVCAHVSGCTHTHTHLRVTLWRELLLLLEEVVQEKDQKLPPW